MDNEKDYNRKREQSKCGEHVLYDHRICLRHKESGYYLSAIPKCTGICESTFLVEVTNHLSPFIQFSFSSELAYRKKEDKV